MNRLFGVFLVSCPSWAAAQITYPGSVEIHSFRTRKATYKPGEVVWFDIELTARNNHQGDAEPAMRAQVWIERALDPLELATEAPIKLDQGKPQTVSLLWRHANRDVWGHRAVVRFIDGRGRLLAEEETLFDVCSNWVNVMRLASNGAWKMANPDTTDEWIEGKVADLRANQFNAFEMWTFSPKPYELAPDAATWPYQYRPEQTKPVSKERLQTWGRVLHREGMRYVAYNETSAIAGPPDWHVYLEYTGLDKPYAHYFEDQGMFVPNALAVADHWAAQLAASVRMFGWDGILMDSGIACFIRTAEGMNKQGEQLTDLSPGEIGYRHLHAAREQVAAINPDFRFLLQNATSISHVGVYEAVGDVYPWIREKAGALEVQRLSENADLYTLEIDAHNEPRDGRYPLTYSKMSVALNSIVEVTGRPLMAWAMLVTPFYDEYSVAFTRPYLAIHLASRTQVHDHFDLYTSVLSEGRHSPAARAFGRYQRFLARYSWYLTDPELRWRREAAAELSVQADRDLFWQYTVYERPREGGGRQVIVHLLNLPDDDTILEQQQIPPVAQNVTVRVPPDWGVQRAVCLRADARELTPLVLTPLERGPNGAAFRVPPVPCWSVLVLDTDPRTGVSRQ